MMIKHARIGYRHEQAGLEFNPSNLSRQNPSKAYTKSYVEGVPPGPVLVLKGIGGGGGGGGGRGITRVAVPEEMNNMYIGQHGYLHWVFFFFLFPLSPSLPLLIPQDRSIDPKKGGHRNLH